jgi:hypothetical protein
MLTYSLVQVIALMLDYSLFGILIYLGTSNISAFVAAKVISIFFCLYCHIYITFSKQTIRDRGNLIYVILSVLSPLASTALFVVLSDVILNILARKFITDLIMGAINYVIIDKLIFSGKKNI